jgi:hypothetical protein
VTVKGAKWRGRDKPAYARKAITTFLQLWATQGKEAALDYAKQVLSEIRSGQGWDWVVQTHRVGKDDTNFLRAGFKVGERAIFAYKVKRKTQKDSEIAKSPDEGYDIQFYSDKFSDLIEEVIEVIDPAQIEAWREIVSQQARPLFFLAQNNRHALIYCARQQLTVSQPASPSEKPTVASSREVRIYE